MILVTGATGTVGREVVRQLLAAKKSIRVLVRDPEKATFGAGVEVVQGDLSKPETLPPALKGIERAFLLTSAHPDQVKWHGGFVDAAKQAGVQQIVRLSAMGADVKSPLALGRWHGECEQHLERSGIAYTHLRPNAFMQNVLMFLQTMTAQGAFYAPIGDATISLVDVRDIAAVAVKALTASGHEGKTYILTGPEPLSYAQVAEELSMVCGKKVHYVNVPPEAAKQGMVQAGMPAWLADALLELYDVWRKGFGATVTETIREVTGQAPRSFAQFAKDHAAVLSGSSSQPRTRTGASDP